MSLRYAFWSASGPTLVDCHCLVHRMHPVDDNRCESWVMQVLDGRVDSVIHTVGRYHALWRSSSGAVFVGGAGDIHWSDDPVQGGGDWSHQEGVAAYGVWGLGDDLVMAWGDPMGKDIFRFDGKAWKALAAPGWVLDVHGTGPDAIFAAGKHGVARLDGETWERMSTKTGGQFTAVHVASPQEVYAIKDRQQVWLGRGHQWQPICEPRGVEALTSVVKWGGDVWVGDGYLGLSRLKNGTLQVVKDNLRPTHLDARRDLLITCELRLSHSTDGQKFRGFQTPVIEAIFKDQPPAWE